MCPRAEGTSERSRGQPGGRGQRLTRAAPPPPPPPPAAPGPTAPARVADFRATVRRGDRRARRTPVAADPDAALARPRRRGRAGASRPAIAAAPHGTAG